jgi:uncharacterized phage protein gp47/JayE
VAWLKAPSFYRRKADEMFTIPTLKDLRQLAADDVETDVNGTLGSRLRRALAFALAAYGYMYLRILQWEARQMFVDLADEAFKLLHASIYGITPNAATASSGSVRATGVDGTVIPALQVLARDDGAEFLVQAPAVIGSVITGEVDVTVSASEAGEAGNTLTGTELTFVSPPVGLDAAALVLGDVGEDGLADGFDAEEAVSVGVRTLARIQSVPRGGSETDYVGWATDVSGVAQAWAFDAAYGIGTVLVIIAQEWDPTDPGDSPVPSAGLLATVEASLTALKPAGLHGVFVQGPVEQPLDPFIVLTPDTADIRSAVLQSLALALAQVEPGGIAYYDDLVKAVDRAAGEQHHRLFVSDGLGGYGPYDTPVDATSLLVPGTPTWAEPP